MPGPCLVGDFTHWLDAGGHAKKMADPALHHAAQPVQRRLGIGKIDRGVEHVGARPVFIRRLGGEDVDADLVGRLALLQHPRHAGLKLHGGVVRHHDAPVIKGHSLVSEQAFGGAQFHRVRLAIEDRAQDDLRHLLQKQRREIHRRAAHHRQIGGLQRRMLGEEITESQHGAIIVDDVPVLDGVELFLADRGEGLGAEMGVKRQLRIAGILLRRDLVTSEIGHHEIACRDQMAVDVTLQQMPSGCKPEILCHPVPLPARACPSPLPPLSRFSARRRIPASTGCGSAR